MSCRENAVDRGIVYILGMIPIFSKAHIRFTQTSQINLKSSKLLRYKLRAIPLKSSISLLSHYTKNLQKSTKNPSNPRKSTPYRNNP